MKTDLRIIVLENSFKTIKAEKASPDTKKIEFNILKPVYASDTKTGKSTEKKKVSISNNDEVIKGGAGNDTGKTKGKGKKTGKSIISKINKSPNEYNINKIDKDKDSYTTEKF
jgi:hypothetical protein